MTGLNVAQGTLRRPPPLPHCQKASLDSQVWDSQWIVSRYCVKFGLSFCHGFVVSKITVWQCHLFSRTQNRTQSWSEKLQHNSVDTDLRGCGREKNILHATCMGSIMAIPKFRWLLVKTKVSFLASPFLTCFIPGPPHPAPLWLAGHSLMAAIPHAATPRPHLECSKKKWLKNILMALSSVMCNFHSKLFRYTLIVPRSCICNCAWWNNTTTGWWWTTWTIKLCVFSFFRLTLYNN